MAVHLHDMLPENPIQHTAQTKEANKNLVKTKKKKEANLLFSQVAVWQLTLKYQSQRTEPLNTLIKVCIII